MQKKRAETFRRRISARYAPRLATDAAVTGQLVPADHPGRLGDDQVRRDGAEIGEDHDPQPHAPVGLVHAARDEGGDHEHDGANRRGADVREHVDQGADDRQAQPHPGRHQAHALGHADERRDQDVGDDGADGSEQHSKVNLLHRSLPVA